MRINQMWKELCSMFERDEQQKYILLHKSFSHKKYDLLIYYINKYIRYNNKYI